MELAKAYDPKQVEDKWYADWLNNGYFKATPGEGKPYCVTIPPPNITGSLHIGHALNNTVIDTLTRWHRMSGDNTLTVPGTDHAGIATQNVVEKQLAKDGLSRHAIGREKFIEKCWEWRKEYGDRIYLQFHKLGCSYDWDRARFTMDESYVNAIHEEFLRWWDRGLIKRGARVVNWCPRCQSAISDIEVNSEERQGKLYHFKYPFADGSGFVTIATTRPETLLGDAAVAAHPDDARYQSLFGKMLALPLTDRQIPLVADSYAKMEFGTGAVKVTPAHDLNDFEAGIRNQLQQIVVIGIDGKMTEIAGPGFAGLDRFDARKKVVEAMEALGLLERIEDYKIQLPLCDRCGTVIEPLLSEQWFAEMRSLAQPAIDAVESGKINFIPERYKRIFLDWMEKIQPWCISRQLWWGHQIPVWWTEDGKYTAARSAVEAAEKLGVSAQLLKQDEDVLDTWFSSALWPHAVLGWPEESKDLDFWYPTNLLSTAQEIIFLWVARMIMTGMDFVGEIPFHDVYIHATVLDEKGERMSKSKGNGVDPLVMADTYGADALRFYLLQHAGMNQDIRFREDGVKLAGQFCNKLWNASRFVMMNLTENANEGTELARFVPSLVTPEDTTLSTPDRWILSRLQRTIAAVTDGISTYNMDAAMRAIYSFVWDDFCDWYLELAKPRLRESGEERITTQNVLYHVLETTLRLLHPMIPFITEEIWQNLTGAQNATIMRSEFPLVDELWVSDSVEGRMDIVIEAIRAARNLRAEIGLPPGQRLPGAIVPKNVGAATIFADNQVSVIGLARLTDLTFMDSAPGGGGAWAGSPIAGGEIFIEIGQALDIPKELERINKELESLSKDILASDTKLANSQFTDRAPATIVQKERDYNAAMHEKQDKLIDRKNMLSRG